MTGDPGVEAIDVISELLNRRIGLRPEPNLRGRLERCLREDTGGSHNVTDYVQRLAGGGAALQSLVNRVTVQETGFFRHPEHFELLAKDVLPGLHQPVTMWSAACSNGQEAYSLAMLLEELGMQGSVVATDLSTTAVQRTLDARYTEREIAGLSPQRIARHLDRHGNHFQIKRNIRARVSARQYNLLDPIPGQVAQCQVVFCRNVLIYFAPAHARAFLARLSSALPAAALFLGAAETIWQLTDQYDTIRTGDTFFYRRSSPATSADDRRTAAPKRAPAPARSAATGPSGSRRDHGAPVVSAAAGNLVRPTALAHPTRTPRAPSPEDHEDLAMAATLGLAGQRATAAGDVAAAVVAFRKSAYLAPHDPMTHLNLGLALETAGDRASAQRAYAAARNALSHVDRARIEHATEGYQTEDLARFIHHKQQQVYP